MQRIDMPSVGQTTDQLVIVEWLKKEGDAVALGESLFSVQTDKAQVEVESVAAGTLLKVLQAPAPVPRTEPERRSPERTPGQVAALPAARRLASALGINLTTLSGTGQDGVITVRDVEQAAESSSEGR
jgi:pyruvate dehydrogenase E2 component (dihydrolipoamide acetyltransferase)